MRMGSKEGIEKIELADEIYVCPGCNYTDGFHVSFKKDEQTNGWEIILICPQCHRRYAVGWDIAIDNKG